MEKELIPLAHQEIDGEAVQTVNARDLHAFLGVGKDFSTWIQDRIRKYNFIESQYLAIDSPKLGNQSGRGGDRRSKNYYLTLDMAKEISMAENTPMGQEARRYFIACEKELKAIKTVQRQPKVQRMPERSPADRMLPAGLTLAMIRRDIRELTALGRMAGLDRNQALLAAIEHESILAGFDVRACVPASLLSLPSPVQDSVFLRPTDIAERLNVRFPSGSSDPKAANLLLEKAGLQIRAIHADGGWTPTEKGKSFAHWRDVPKAGVAAGRLIRQLFWREEVLPQLVSYVQKQPEPLLQ